MCVKSRATGNPQAELKLVAEIVCYQPNITVTKNALRA